MCSVLDQIISNVISTSVREMRTSFFLILRTFLDEGLGQPHFIDNIPIEDAILVKLFEIRALIVAIRSVRSSVAGCLTARSTRVGNDCWRLGWCFCFGLLLFSGFGLSMRLWLGALNAGHGSIGSLAKDIWIVHASFERSGLRGTEDEDFE